MLWKERVSLLTPLNRCAGSWATATSAAIKNRITMAPSQTVSSETENSKTEINLGRATSSDLLKTKMGHRTGTDVGRIRIEANSQGKANLRTDGARTANSQGKADHRTDGARTASSRVAAKAARRAALTEIPPSKAIRPTEAAARPEVMTVANSAPKYAKACARPKTYAATWARIVIWRLASIRRFKVCGAPTTRSCETTCKPRCY